jgi:opacity protein-like surface antigen
MMKAIIVAGALLAAVSLAVAQDRPANPKGDTPAVTTPRSGNPTAPVEGANSFTEGQAKSRIESNGYTNVSGLAKDDQGVWRGRATKDGRQVNVSLDYQGNVTSN